MSSYFDAMDKRIYNTADLPEVRAGERSRAEALKEIEEELVRDVTVCADWPGFPGGYRHSIHRAILRHGTHTLPSNAPEIDYAEDSEYAARLANLNYDLHSIFHAVASSNVPVCPIDSPLGVIRVALDAADDFRAALYTELTERGVKP